MTRSDLSCGHTPTFSFVEFGLVEPELDPPAVARLDERGGAELALRPPLLDAGVDSVPSCHALQQHRAILLERVRLDLALEAAGDAVE